MAGRLLRLRPPTPYYPPILNLDPIGEEEGERYPEGHVTGGEPPQRSEPPIRRTEAWLQAQAHHMPHSTELAPVYGEGWTPSLPGVASEHSVDTPSRTIGPSPSEAEAWPPFIRPGAHVETHALAPPPPAATATAQNMNQSDVCVSCTQSIRRTSVRVTCGHTFDMKCFLDRCWGAARDESMFPPSCCQKPFNLRLYEQALGRDLIDLLERKRKEFGIRTIDRVYCHQRTCPTFVGVVTPSATNYRCPKCGADTCGHCEEKGHYSGIQCTRPYGGSEGLADGVRQKRCPACGQRIQFATGCNNVTCECSYRFCTACKARWGTCLCGQPDADRPNEAAGSQAHRHNTGKSVEHGIAVHDGWRVPRGPPESTVECPRGYHVCAHSWKRCIGGLSPCDGCRMVELVVSIAAGVWSTYADGAALLVLLECDV